MLLEALIGAVIFAIGVLALIGLQGKAVQASLDAKLRVEAGYLANQIISQMWVDRSNLNSYRHYTTGSNCSFSGDASTSAKVTTWIGATDKVGTVLGTLPNASAQILVDTDSKVTVTLCWRPPQGSDTRKFTSTALIQG